MTTQYLKNAKTAEQALLDLADEVEQRAAKLAVEKAAAAAKRAANAVTAADKQRKIRIAQRAQLAALAEAEAAQAAADDAKVAVIDEEVGQMASFINGPSSVPIPAPVEEPKVSEPAPVAESSAPAPTPAVEVTPEPAPKAVLPVSPEPKEEDAFPPIRVPKQPPKDDVPEPQPAKKSVLPEWGWLAWLLFAIGALLGLLIAGTWGADVWVRAQTSPIIGVPATIVWWVGWGMLIGGIGGIFGSNLETKK